MPLSFQTPKWGLSSVLPQALEHILRSKKTRNTGAHHSYPLSLGVLLPSMVDPYLMLGLLAFFLRTKTCLIYQCSCHPQSLPSPPLVPLVAENSLALPSIFVPPETGVLTFKPTAINEVRLWCSPTRCLPWPSSGSQGYQPGHQPTAFAVTHQGLFLAPFLLQGWPILIMASQFW